MWHSDDAGVKLNAAGVDVAFEMTPEKETLCIGKGTSDSNKKELSSPSVLQVFSWYENQISLKKKYYF